MTPSKQMNRQDIEDLILKEEQAIARCADLLKNKTSPAQWPDALREAFLLAVTPVGDSFERHKAMSLRHHIGIVGAKIDPPKDANQETRRIAERLRADLHRFVRLRSGVWLNNFLGDLGRDGKNGQNLGHPSF